MGTKGHVLAPVATLVLATITAAGCLSRAQSDSPYRAVASVDEIMDGIVIPASQAIFDAVVYSNGELVQAPKNDDDWFRLRVSAMAVAESGNLLMMPPRSKGGDWPALSRALTDAAVKVAEAAESKDIERILATGGAMYSTCTACHEKYLEDNAQ